MWIIICVLTAPVEWIVLGSIILAALDNEDELLFKWVKESPIGFTATMMFWPAIVWLIWRNRKNV